MPTLEEAFATAQKLVADFRANEAHYLSPAYQESEVRNDFISKFFIALGWDVNHDQQKNPFQQEVKVERGVTIGGTQRWADYAFYIAPNCEKDDVRFYAEAKKPFGEIATLDNCFQTIRYGWPKKIPVAVLTSFSQFLVLDCRYKPDVDTARDRILSRYHYSDYAIQEKFAEIYFLFSRDAVAGGSLEQYAESLARRRGKGARGLPKGAGQSIDDAFLVELDKYRETLAHAFKNRNPDLDGQTLTEITQRTIDRLVFMRFLEDKLILPEHLVSHFGDKGSAWQDFVAASRRLDGIYNGIVFKKHAALDAPDFKVDGGFADICKDLSRPDTAYKFYDIPIHILGSIYERFLGKVIVTTDKRARVEEKPEVRKAGGVYYTPEYIVRYIVENTVGKLIAGKTPAQIAEMRFADIACGSGSFLLGIYDLLLRYHRDWHNAHPKQAEKAGCVMHDDGAWHLSLSQRREILLNNIYGVDIDFQAVEVAQLSLYLKLLEEETTASARAYQLEFPEPLLPPLDKNVVCGNSLIGTDIMEGHLFEPKEERKLNPMAFEQRFPEVMKRGGFDAIVGNPPYVLLQPQNVEKIELDYLQSHFRVAQYKIDIFHLFIERGLSLTKVRGYIGHITPASFLTNNGTVRLRREILKKAKLGTVVVLPDGVFRQASVDNVVFTCQREPAASRRERNVFPFLLANAGKTGFKVYDTLRARQSDFLNNKGLIFHPARTPEFADIAGKMEIGACRLGDIARVNFGMQLRDRAKYPSDVLVNPKRSQITPKHRRCLGGSDVQIYRTGFSGIYCLFDRVAQRGGCWDEKIQFAKRKVLVRQIGKTPVATLETEGLCCLNALFMIKSLIPQCDEAFLLGLINSRLFRFYWTNKYYDFKDTFPKIKGTYLEELPIRKPDLSDPAERFRHDRMVRLVEQMLEAKKRQAAASSDTDRNYYAARCDGLDRQIDALVYELYGLTPEEIRIVEGAAA